MATKAKGKTEKIGKVTTGKKKQFAGLAVEGEKAATAAKTEG
jgi:hypothetical protein